MDTATIAYTDRIEQELSRLRAARPELENRIATAERMLVTQLSVPAAVRPIRVRLAAGGHVYAVRSNSKLRRTYAVEPSGWTCECAWQERGGSACSHAIACYVLEQVSRRDASNYRGAA